MRSSLAAVAPSLRTLPPPSRLLTEGGSALMHALSKPPILLHALALALTLQVRVPVGYWITDAPVGGSSPLEYGISPEGFVTGGLNHLHRMLVALRKRGALGSLPRPRSLVPPLDRAAVAATRVLPPHQAHHHHRV